MQRLATLGVMLGLIAVFSTGSLAGPPPMQPPCCACLENSSAPEPAFFCGYFPGALHGAAEDRCGLFNSSDIELFCIDANASDCREALAGLDIACPPASGAPTASTGMLTTLVALLGAAGYFAARRRPASRD